MGVRERALTTAEGSSVARRSARAPRTKGQEALTEEIQVEVANAQTPPSLSIPCSLAGTVCTAADVSCGRSSDCVRCCSCRGRKRQRRRERPALPTAFESVPCVLGSRRCGTRNLPLSTICAAIL